MSHSGGSSSRPLLTCCYEYLSDALQSVPDFQTPFILDDSYDHTTFVGEHFGDQFQDGLVAKPASFMAMPAYEKHGDVLGHHAASTLHDSNRFVAYHQMQPAPYNMYSSAMNTNVQEPDFQYVPSEHYTQPANFAPERHQYVVPPPRQAFSNEAFQNSRVQALEHNTSRKRKASPDLSDYDITHPQKKQVAQFHVQDSNGEYYDFSGQNSPYSPYVPTPSATVAYHSTPIAATSPRINGHNYSHSTASQPSLAAPSPHTPAWSPSFTTVKTEASPRAPMTPVPRPASTSSQIKSSVPRLVRTSTIQQSPAAMTAHMGIGHNQNFNPYAMYPLKANLKLKGDLDSMTKEWNSDELEARRRLVEFKRSQSGNTITADFKPVAPQDRAPNSITISCILWKEKNEYYVTSVDTIYLLEALVGVRFTVEEKNRIRRNLEGFRPATVSKSKSDSEEFFKIIMGFPHPKPRNIEKDVKVFPWKILAHALKKIISKYSASYSSTASALLTPGASGYTSTDSSADYVFPSSPQHEYVGPQSGSYPVISGAMYPGHPVHNRPQMQMTTAPIPELQVQVPGLMPVYDMQDPYNFSNVPGMPQASMPMMSHAMSAPVDRMQPTWEYPTYIHEHPASMTPNSAPPVAYHRGPIDTADFVSPQNFR